MSKDKGKDKPDKTNAMRLLDAAHIPYSSHSYDTSDGLIDGLSVAAKLDRPAGQIFKTLVAMGASRSLYVFVIPVCSELDLKKAAKAAGEKSIAMLPQKELLKNTGYVHGGCSPLGMKKLYPTFVDDSAQAQETIIVSAGRIGAQIECAPQQLLQLTKGSFYQLCQL